MLDGPMGRRRRNRSDAEEIAGAVLGLVLLAAFGIGGVKGFPQVLGGMLSLLLVVLFSGIALLVAFLLGRKLWRSGFLRTSDASVGNPARRFTPNSPPVIVIESTASHTAPKIWDFGTIRTALEEIDWYQFEKFCAALLTADGFAVERKGGAQPDGGVDLIVTKDGGRALIQCKHWRTWTVQERVVREMLGSMTHHGVRQGAIYTLKGWTEPAARFAAEHDITLVNGDELAKSAAFQLTPTQLEAVLDTRQHHCPKCESPMLWKEGNFTPFWGCSRYPRCRGKLNYSGAK